MEVTTTDYENTSFNFTETDNNNSQELERISITLITYISPVEICVCLLGNSLTIFILGRKRNRVTSAAVLLTNLAISDIVIVLIGILDSWLLFVWNVDIRISNEIICKVHVFLTYFSILRKPICDIVFCVMSFLFRNFECCVFCFVYNVAQFRRRNSRGRAKMENKRQKEDKSNMK